MTTISTLWKISARPFKSVKSDEVRWREVDFDFPGLASCFTNVPIFQSAGGGYQSASLGGPALDTGLTSPQSPDTYGSPQVETTVPTYRHTGN